MILRVAAAIGVAAIVVLATTGAVTAQTASDGRLAGGGTLNRRIVEMPRRSDLAPIYSLYLSNRSDAPVQADFFADAPRDVTVTPTASRIEVAPGETTQVAYSVRVGRTIDPGDHRVVVGLTRSDVQAAPNEVVIVPRFANEWTLRVSEDVARLRVRVVGLGPRERERAVVRVGRVQRPAPLELARGSADGIPRTRISPGRYVVTLDVAGETIAKRSVTVAAGDDARVVVDPNAEPGGEGAWWQRALKSWWFWTILLGMGAITLLGWFGWHRR